MELSNGFSIERHGSAMVIRFTRPEIRNPLSITVVESLVNALGMLKNESAIVFTGSEDAFASGADLREIADVNGSTAAGFARRGQELMNAIAGSNATTIAAVNGYCFGGALDLALACNTRIASRNAEFCHPGAGLGIMTGWGGTQRLPRLIGEAAALEMFMTGKRVLAAEAKRLGLVEGIVDDPVAVAIAPYL
ncbi:MAG TPA: enoyl-CoA hydratase/isomerase family protein [Pyrinomonadaceae bacterium]